MSVAAAAAAASASFPSTISAPPLCHPPSSLTSRPCAFIPHVRSFSSAAASANVLVVADHNNKQLLSSTLSVIRGATQLSSHGNGKSSVTVLVLGHGCGAVAEQASKVEGVTKVIVVEDKQLEHALPEQSTTIAAIAKEIGASHIVGSTSASGKAILPRLGSHLDVQPITEVIRISSADTFVRPIYAGNAISTVQSSDAVKVLTLRPTSFEKANSNDKQAPVETKSYVSSSGAGSSEWLSEELSVSARPELGSARIVVSGGRGVKSKENFAIIEELADAMGAAVGASRAAVDAGYVPNDYQVGQTGKVVAPDLYVAVGISGAIQHLAGMKDSRVIVAINKDKEAPIFQVADYGLEADLFKAVPEMTKCIKQAKQ